ncbi:hypothetical protein BKA69DRAFT_1099017, partial [Paraphysoderma sedebokerense]
MHFQIASLVALLALVSDTTAAPAPAPEPILPLLAAGGAIAATGALIHGSKSQDKQRHAKMTFVTPNEKTVWQCGQTVQVSVDTFGFGSFWGISTAKLNLITNEGEPLGEIMKQKLSKFIKEERTFGIGRARNGKGTYEWTIPQDVSTGHYKIEYESHNALNMDRSRLRFTSPSFEIQCYDQSGQQGAQQATTESTEPASQ